MSRRLLRTITITVTVSESWTLIWRTAETGEPAIMHEGSRSTSSRSTSAAIVAGRQTVGQAGCAQIGPGGPQSKGEEE